MASPISTGHWVRPMGAPTEEEIMKLVGHRFPGGNRVIEHWENWLLTDCTGREQLPDELVHPVALFHVPIQGAAHRSPNCVRSVRSKEPGRSVSTVTTGSTSSRSVKESTTASRAGLSYITNMLLAWQGVSCIRRPGARPSRCHRYRNRDLGRYRRRRAAGHLQRAFASRRSIGRDRRCRDSTGVGIRSDVSG